MAALISSPVDWGYSTVVQPGLLGTKLPYPRGKVLGGSSGINVMAHLRAHRASYDAWAAGGATGWGNEDLLPYFRRSETANPNCDENYRGPNGPMRVGPPPVTHPYPHGRCCVGGEQDQAGLVDASSLSSSTSIEV